MVPRSGRVKAAGPGGGPRDGSKVGSGGGSGGQARAALLVIDVQARLAPAIPAAPLVIPRIAALIERARDLHVPILVSEQYSQGLGRTLPELRALFGAREIVEKIHFAAPRETAFAAAAAGIRHAVVAGMEAHVCVQQTALALLEAGVAVTLAGDAVASRRGLDRQVALVRLARAGATVVDTADLLAAWPVAPVPLSPPVG